MPAPARRRLPPVALAAVLAVAGGVSYWLSPHTPPTKPPDMVAARFHNARGVEMLEDDPSDEAAAEFAAAVAAAPDWPPARINLGITLFHLAPADTKYLPAQVKQARAEFTAVLDRDPDNPHAHYCLGMMDVFEGDYRAARPHFLAVNQIDPDDAHTWLWLGSTHPDGQDSDAALVCYEKALAGDPCLNEARFRIWRELRETDEKRAGDLFGEYECIKTAGQETPSRIEFGVMGRYANPIGRTVAGPALRTKMRHW